MWGLKHDPNESAFKADSQTQKQTHGYQRGKAGVEG